MYLNSRPYPHLYGFIWLDYASKKGLTSFISEIDYVKINHLEFYIQLCQKWIVFLFFLIPMMLIWRILQLIIFLSIGGEEWGVTFSCSFSYPFCMLLFQWKTSRTMTLVSEIVQDKDKEKITSDFRTFIHIAAKSSSIYIYSQYFPYAKVLVIKDWHLNKVTHSVWLPFNKQDRFYIFFFFKY